MSDMAALVIKLCEYSIDPVQAGPGHQAYKVLASHYSSEASLLALSKLSCAVRAALFAAKSAW